MPPKAKSRHKAYKKRTQIKFLENKRTMSGMKNSLDGINCQLDIAKEKN